jgi:hypothetical protein
MKVNKTSLSLVLAGFASIATLLVAACSGGGSSSSPEAATHDGHSPVQSDAALTLHDGMRKLWEDHITWTRLAIISLEADSPDASATTQRLLQNQVDIGNAIKPYYGDEAGNKLTALLRDHILIAADIIAAAKTGDNAGVAAASARWNANADEIATFLSSANPNAWPVADMKSMMHEHLDLTLQEAVAHLKGDYAADIAAYDKVHGQILSMADMLTAGIVQQFPEKFAAS